MGILNMESIVIDCRLRKRGSLQLQENQDLSCVTSSNSSGNTRVRRGYVRSHSSQQLGVTGRDDNGEGLICVTPSQNQPSRSGMTHSSSQHVIHRTGSGGQIVSTGSGRREVSLDQLYMTSDGIRRTGSNHDLLCRNTGGVQRSGSSHDLMCMTSDGTGHRGHQGCTQRHSFGGNTHQLMYMPRAVIHRGGHHPGGRHSYHSRSSWLIGDLASLRSDWPLKFHQVRGDNVELNEDESRAKRGDSFCKAICFSNRPIAVNERVYIKFAETSSSWSGVLRFGFTNIDPGSLRGSDLPRYACPDMTNKPGNWAKALAERYATPNNLLHFYVTRAGDVYYGVNGEDVGLFFSGVNTSDPIWALLDIYGNTIAVEFVNPEQPMLNNLITPPHSSNIVSAGDTNSELLSALSNLTMNSGQSPSSTSQFPSVRHYANVTFTPLRWHSLCGKNVQFSHNRTVAARAQEEYCNGYVFSSRPLKCGEKIVIQVLGVDRSYVGGLGVGLTACSPSKVQIEELPDDSDLLLDRLEYWVVNKDVCRSPEIGDELCFHLTNEGELRYTRNNQRLNTLMHVDRTLPLWVFFDIYGNVQKIRALGTAMHQPPVPPRPRSTSYLGGGQQGSLTVMLPPRDSQPQSQNLANMSYSNVNMSPSTNQQPHMMRSYSVPSQSLPPPISPAPHQNTGSKQPVSLPVTSQTSVDNADGDNRDECTVCYERQVNAALYTCGHLCMCFECAHQVKQRKGLCPICRQEIKDVIKIFKT